MMSSLKSAALKPKASFGKMESSLAFLLSDQIIPFKKIDEMHFILFANLLILENQKGVNSPWRQAIANWLSLQQASKFSCRRSETPSFAGGGGAKC